MRVGDRVLTPDLRVGTILRLIRSEHRSRPGEWWAVVQMDNGGVTGQWLRDLAPYPPRLEVVK